MTDYLAAMAVIKVNYDRRGHDVLQMLVPFVADCARRAGQPLSDDQIQGDLRDTFGLPVPRTVIKTLLRRLARSGALSREHGVFVAVPSEISKPEYDLAGDVVAVQGAQETLIRRGTDFALRTFGLELSAQELAQALLTLVRQEVAPLAVWAVKRTPVTFDENVSEGLAQVAAQYILHVIEDGTAEDQKALEQIAKGSLLSGVLWSTDLDAPRRKIEGLELFLDTTLLLRLLGLCGPAREAFAEELAQLARESSIKLICFEHNRNEIVGILSAAAAVLRSSRSKYYGEAVEFMVSNGWTPSDVEEVIASLDERLGERGVEVQQRPSRQTRYNMDETRLRHLLNVNVHYSNPAALDADVDSLASIFILRRASYSDRIESSRAAFVTTNTNLALSSRQLYKIGETDLKGVPLALIETQIASYLWARHSGPEGQLPLNLLAMGALATAESEPKVWYKYVEKLEELRDRERISERDYVLLRQSLLARSILLSTTDGNADAFSEDTADFVLKHALAEHTRELQLDIQRRDEALAEKTRDVAESEARATKAASEQEAAMTAQYSMYRAVARRNAHRFVLIFGILLAIIVLCGALVSFPWPTNTPLSALLPAWFSISLGICAVIIGTASVVVGCSVRGVGKSVMSRLATFLERRYRARFTPEESSPDASGSPGATGRT